MSMVKPFFSITLTVLCTVAILILFTAATRARVIAAYFLFITNGLGTLYLAGIFHGSTATGSYKLGFGCFYQSLLPGCWPCLAHILGLLLGDFSLEQETYNIFIHLDQHIPEQVESFHFINNNGIFLLIHRILDGLLQLIHISQVFFPGLINQRKDNTFLKRFKHVLSACFDGLLQISCHLDTANAIGERNNNIFNLLTPCGKHIGKHRERLFRYFIGFLTIKGNYPRKKLFRE